METINDKRIAKLDSLTNCPVCGGKLNMKTGGHKGRRLYFLCGATFVVAQGHPIQAIIPCPTPSNTAAELLDLEIVQADHFEVAVALTFAKAGEA